MYFPGNKEEKPQRKQNNKIRYNMMARRHNSYRNAVLAVIALLVYTAYATALGHGDGDGEGKKGVDMSLLSTQEIEKELQVSSVTL